MSLLSRLGARLDTAGGEARMKRFREGWPARATAGVAFFRTPKVQYRFLVAGAGPTIVFTADPPMTIEIYGELVEVFARDFRVVVVELPAMGFSATGGDYGFAFRETNDDLALFLAEVAGPGAIFAFSCVAGLAAVDIAARRPELCAALTLMQTGDVAASARWKQGRDPKGVLAKPVFGQLAMRRLGPSRMPLWYRLSVGRKERIEAFCACAQRSFEHGALWSLASAYQIYMDPGLVLERPAQPLLSLWGGADGSHAAENAHTLRSLVPDAVCETYPDLGHTPELEDPARVKASISAFLARPASSSVETRFARASG